MDLKFKIKDPQHSTQIQKILFKLGFGWGNRKNSDHQDVQLTGMHFLFTQTSDSTITYASGKDASFFNTDHNRTEAFLLHPKQLKFLQNLSHINTMIETIIKNKIYYITDRGFLNDLLKK